MEVYEEFKNEIDKTIDTSDIVKFKLQTTGVTYEFYQYVIEISEEDNMCVLSFDDDSTLALDCGALSFKETDTYGKKGYLMEGSDIVIEVTIM